MVRRCLMQVCVGEVSNGGCTSRARQTGTELQTYTVRHSREENRSPLLAGNSLGGQQENLFQLLGGQIAGLGTATVEGTAPRTRRDGTPDEANGWNEFTTRARRRT